jgi:hypothetical protein
MQPLSRPEAIASGSRWYFTGKPCKRGHIAKRQTNNKGCSECQKAAYARWESKNLATRSAEKCRRRAANPERSNEIQRNSRLRNPEGIRASRRRYYLANRADFIANSKARKAAQANRTPIWSDLSACRAFYVMAARATACTGIRFSVDHVIPLRGRRVSGLHVPDNLRVMPLRANIAKGNRA